MNWADGLLVVLLLMAGAYMALLAAVFAGFLFSAYRKPCGWLCRALAGLSLAMLLAPPGCFYFGTERMQGADPTTGQPRVGYELAEGFEVAFFGTFAAALLIGCNLHWVLCVWRLMRTKVPGGARG